MWWKIYFWVYAIFTGFGILAYTKYIPWTLGDILDLFLGVVSVLAVYTYVYKKSLFTNQFWKVSFWVLIITTALGVLYDLTVLKTLIPLPGFLQTQIQTDAGGYIFGLILVAPALYAHYKLVYTKKTHTAKPAATRKKTVKKKKRS